MSLGDIKILWEIGTLAATKTIRSVERAILMLRVLHHRSPITLSQAAVATSLSKSTALRILLTLQEGGLVRRGLADGLYRVTTGLNFLEIFDAEAERFADIGAPIIDKLRRKIGWPMSLDIRRGLNMISVESSRQQSPYGSSLDVARLGERVNIIASAVGRAYLAKCSGSEYKEILAAAAKDDNPLSRYVNDRVLFDNQITEIQEQGYALRAPNYMGQTEHTGLRYDDGLMSIAVAVKGKKMLYGSLVVHWSKPAATADEMVGKFLDELQAAGKEIASKLEDASIR